VKRHPALEQLSRDHHHALVVARELKRANSETAERAREAFLDYWRSDGADHFREGEEILLPAFTAYADPDQPVVARVLIDHVRIRRLADEIAGSAGRLETLRSASEALERHVRREERELSRSWKKRCQIMSSLG
jgi:hypothetical protein